MNSSSKKLKLQSIISGILILIGLLLMVLKIYEDSEPGAIPMLLILSGIALYFFNEQRNISKQTKSH